MNKLLDGDRVSLTTWREPVEQDTLCTINKIIRLMEVERYSGTPWGKSSICRNCLCRFAGRISEPDRCSSHSHLLQLQCLVSSGLMALIRIPSHRDIFEHECKAIRITIVNGNGHDIT